VAVFRAFSGIVSQGHSAFVVLDTAPKGHSMSLMDAIGATHWQMTREFEGHGPFHIVLRPCRSPKPLLPLHWHSRTRAGPSAAND
jgi:arsenite-transporting ATPase